MQHKHENLGRSKTSKVTHDVHRLVKDPRLDIVLAFEKACKQLHLEVLCDAIRRHALEAGTLPLRLAHAFARALHISHTTVRLVPVLQLLVIVGQERLRLRCRRKEYQFLSGFGRPLGLRRAGDGVYGPAPW